MKKRQFVKTTVLTSAGLLLAGVPAWAKTYLSREQAAKALFPSTALKPVPVTLTLAQRKAIRKASRVNPPSNFVDAHRTSRGEWLIYAEVIGKHENIDMAFALDSQGRVKGMEILVYRETYGHEIRSPRWRAQFHGRGPQQHLKLDRDIANISGATLSCRHVTDAVNRLTQTWRLVLSQL